MTPNDIQLNFQREARKYKGWPNGHPLPDALNALFEGRCFEQMPFEDFFRMAAERSLSEANEPEEGFDNNRAYQSRTLAFARDCLSHSKLAFLTVDEISERIPWQLTPFDEGDRMRFREEWLNVHYIPGVDPQRWAWGMAQRFPLKPPGKCQEKVYSAFISLAGWLQARLGHGNVILLPCREIAEVMGLRRMRAISDLRQQALRDELLEIVKEHSFKDREATEFLFKVEWYPIFKDWVAK